MLDRVTGERERLLERDCEGCGRRIEYAGTGRPPRFCGASCRKRTWSLRAAERALGTVADPRPEVVREVVERERVVVRERVVEQPAPAPATAREWAAVLHELAAQLGNPEHRVAREHWNHRLLSEALAVALTQLDQAHPGGLAHLGWR